MERSYPCSGSGSTVGSRRDSFQVVPARAEGTVEDGDWDRSDLLQLGRAARERRVEFRNEIGIPLGGAGSEERGVVGPVVEDRCGYREHAILRVDLYGMSAAPFHQPQEVVNAVVPTHHCLRDTVVEDRRVAFDAWYRPIQVAATALLRCHPHIQTSRPAEYARRQVAEGEAVAVDRVGQVLGQVAAPLMLEIDDALRLHLAL